MSRVLILADGVWEDAAQARALASAADFVMAADGAYAKARAAGAHVDLVIGDFDSLDPAHVAAIERDGAEIRRFPVAKDSSDLELALDEAFGRRPQAITILGGLGRRLDHTLSNVHLLERGLAAGVHVRLVDGAQSATVASGHCEIDGAEIGDLVSLVPLSESARVSTVGLRYALADEELFRASSRAVSNEVTSRPAAVHVSFGTVLVIRIAKDGVR